MFLRLLIAMLLEDIFTFLSLVQAFCMRQTWDLKPFAAVLQCLHLDKHLFELQNTKKS